MRGKMNYSTMMHYISLQSNIVLLLGLFIALFDFNYSLLASNQAIMGL